MYGLPSDTDLDFLKSAPLIQVCVGENEIILNLHLGISITIASSVCIAPPGGPKSTLDEAREIAPAVLPLLGSQVTDASVVSPGTLRLVWSSGHLLDVLDSWSEFESYTISHGDAMIVV